MYLLVSYLEGEIAAIWGRVFDYMTLNFLSNFLYIFLLYSLSIFLIEVTIHLLKAK